MPRVRLSKDELKIAKAGYNVDTATPEQMIFSSDSPALRLYSTGTVTLAPYSGPMSSRFNRAVVNYPSPSPFSKPPLVLAAGIINSTTTEQGPFLAPSGVSSVAWANYSIASFTNRFEIYGYSYNVDGSPVTPSRPTSTYRYFVFHNTMDDS